MKIDRDAPIGVFDSGVGGLTVAREIMRNLPSEKIVYFGDTARVPYGSKSKETIIRYSRQIIHFLREQQVKAIVIACNTASAFALDAVKDELDIPVDKISDTLKVSGRHISVDAPFVEGEDNSLLDVLVNDDAPIADRSLMNESLAKEIDRALATLTERECEIIKMFFGIGCQEMTLEEIGDKFGLTRERVRQIKEKAIRRLRQGTRSKLLKSYLG